MQITKTGSFYRLLLTAIFTFSCLSLTACSVNQETAGNSDSHRALEAASTSASSVLENQGSAAKAIVPKRAEVKEGKATAKQNNDDDYYVDYEGDCSVDLAYCSSVSFSDSALSITGEISVNGRGLRWATRNFKLARNCTFYAEWGDGGTSDANEVKNLIKESVGWDGTVDFSMRGGEVVTINAGIA